MIKAVRIASGIYQGPCPPSTDAVRANGFTVLTFCAREIQPYLPEHLLRGLIVMYVPLNDDGLEPMTDAEWKAACEAGHEIARLTAQGGRALTTCAMGLNRSGVTNALALHYRFGCSGPETVDRIRKARGPQALGNQSFVRRLDRLPAIRPMFEPRRRSN